MEFKDVRELPAVKAYLCGKVPNDKKEIEVLRNNITALQGMLNTKMRWNLGRSK